MFEGFSENDLPTERGTIRARVGGEGPPVLLLHGYPQTHLMWHAVAPKLADSGYRVVVADLPGYGDSTPPEVAEDHSAHSKRAMGADLVAAMQSLGHDRFAVIGHDRGARVGYRMALDHPQAVERLAVLDIVPTSEVWERADARLALAYWHQSFLAQPAPLPERLILGDPDAFFEHHVRRIGVGARPDRYPPEVMEAYRALLSRPDVVEAICEDYRAGASVDREHDAADREAGRTIDCPALTLWGSQGAMEFLYGDPVEVWRPWAPAIRGRAVEASHFLAEDEPAEVAGELVAFLTER